MLSGMAAKRILFARLQIPITSPPRSTLARHSAPASFQSHLCSQIRSHAQLSSSSKVYSYEEIKALSSNPSPDRLLVDVREPGEFEQGAIPTAVNLPIASAPEALTMPEEEFEDRFNFEKPSKEKEVVFYCKAGVRSSAAAQLALNEGYQKVGEYRGSWLDWVKNREEKN